MIDFTRIRDDANGIDTILFECNDQLEYYKRVMDSEISNRNNPDIIEYYKSRITNLEKSIIEITKDNPGNTAIIYLLSGINLNKRGFIGPTNCYLYHVLQKAVGYDGFDKLYMIYMRGMIYVKSIHNIVRDAITKLSISISIDKVNDSSFEYNINNIISEINKLNLSEPINTDIIKYISKIYVMIFDLMDYYKTLMEYDKKKGLIW